MVPKIPGKKWWRQNNIVIIRHFILERKIGNRGNNAVVVSDYHVPHSPGYSRDSLMWLVKEGVPCWAKTTTLFCFVSISLIYSSPQPHVI